jgi:hypothetical protein
MAQKRKPNISQKPVSAETQKTAPVVIPKQEVKSYAKTKQPAKEAGIGLLFDTKNYLLMIGGIVLIIIGFVIMSGGGSTDPKVFNGEELFSPIRITVAPILILLGFAVEVVAIMLKPKQKTEA